MRKKLLFAVASVFLAVAAMVLPLSSAYAIESFAIETETRIYDAANSYGGYFIPSNYDMGTGNTTYLIDMEGYVIKTWPAIFGWAPELQEDGTVWSGGYIHDWDGNVIWSYDDRITVQAPSRLAEDVEQEAQQVDDAGRRQQEPDPGRDGGQGLGSQYHAVRFPSRRL